MFDKVDMIPKHIEIACTFILCTQNIPNLACITMTSYVAHLLYISLLFCIYLLKYSCYLPLIVIHFVIILCQISFGINYLIILFIKLEPPST